MAKAKRILCPTFSELITPVFRALVQLGGSGSNDEIRDMVISMVLEY